MHSSTTHRRPLYVAPPERPEAPKPALEKPLVVLALRLLGAVLLGLAALLLWPEGQPTHPLSLPDNTQPAASEQPAYSKDGFRYE